MRIVITGASGFIGSYLCDYLLNAGQTIIATARNKSKIPDHHVKNFIPLELDVLNESAFSQMDTMPVDAVVHTSTSNDILSKNPSEGILLSASGTRNVLEFCVRRKIPKIIFFSTFQVYGTELNGTIDENTPVHCENDYGLNHVFGEHYIEMYSRQKKITGIVVRPSNVYGRFMTPYIERWTLVPGCFCKELYLTGKITLLSSGRQTRNFVGLHEVSAGVQAILNHTKNGYSVYNIASEKNLTMLEVAELVKKIFEKRYSKEAVIKIMSDKPQTGNSFHVDLEKIRNIGFNPDNNYNLETEINQIFDHLEKIKNEPSRTV
jgi:UDP-glucose 4-epimerase